jgi:hypothetical protein
MRLTVPVWSVKKESKRERATQTRCHGKKDIIKKAATFVAAFEKWVVKEETGLETVSAAAQEQ